MHPILVTIIIIAITLAIVLGFVTYMYSLWSTEQYHFIVRPIIYARGAELSLGQPILVLYVANEGTRTVKIVRVELVAGDGLYVNNTIWAVRPGIRETIEISAWRIIGNPSPIEPGNVYRVYIYTDELGKLLYDVIVAS